MGDLADDFAFMKEQRKKRRAEIEPDRAKYAIDLLRKNGHVVDDRDLTELRVNGNIKFFPFTGWYSGKGVGSGRGIHNFLKALEKK